MSREPSFRASIALALAVAICGGCGIGAPDREPLTNLDRGSLVPTPPAPARAPTSIESTNGQSSAASDAPQPLAEELVLSYGDTGAANWLEEPASLDEDIDGGDPNQRSDNPTCNSQQMAVLRDAQPLDAAITSWSFANDAASEVVTSAAFVYVEPDVAAEALEAYRQAASECREWRSGGIEGDYGFLHMQTLVEAEIGDDSFGIEESVSMLNFEDLPPTKMVVIAARTGAVVQVTAFVSSLAAAPSHQLAMGHAGTAAALVQEIYD